MISIRAFMRSAGAVLLLTGLGKLISAFGGAEVLQSVDPIFSIPFRYLFWAAGGLEATVAVYCIFGTRIEYQAGLVAWLSTSFLIYRFGLLWVFYQKPCSCLGNMTGVLHISPATADILMKIVLSYLLLGSYGTLFRLWRQHGKAEGRMQNGEVKAEMGVGGDGLR